MGRVAAKHQKEIEKVAQRIETLSDNSQIQGEILGYVEKLLFRAKTGEMSTSTVLQGVMPYFWKVIGAAVDRSPRDARNLYFERDLKTMDQLSLVEEFRSIRLSNMRSYGKVVDDRSENMVVLPLSIWEELASLFDSWLLSYQGTDNDQIARLILSLGFFTGRRPFSEITFTAQFSEIQTPVRRNWKVEDPYDPEYETNFDLVANPAPNTGWADEWMRFDGNGKPTRKEKLAGFSIPLDIPVIGTSVDDMIQGLDRLRYMESDKSWYLNRGEISDNVVRSILQRNLEKAQEEINEILQPIYDAGVVFPAVGGGRNSGKFSPYHLRPIYANRCAYAIAKTAEEGKRDDSTVTKWILGHMSGTGSVIAYRSFEIVDR